MRTHPTPPHDIISAILDLLSRFEPVCPDKETLRKLAEIASDDELWPKGHALFQEIRQKTLKAHRDGDQLALTQYAFEEVCAKTLYNLSRSPAPFDPDSAFWVVPLAVGLGSKLGFSDPAQVTSLLNM